MIATLMAPQTSVNAFDQALKSALRVNWRIEDLIGDDKPLDFGKPFLPESLARVTSIDGLSDIEKVILNQIRGNSYLHLFGVVEEFIVPTVIDHVRSSGYRNLSATQALLHFAEEESKHIRLFRQFAAEFEAGFGSRCDGIGPVQDIVNHVISHQPLGVMLVILYIEWMTQQHYLASVRGNYGENLDPQFCSLLRHHWLEEAQHAVLDTLMVEQLVQSLAADEIQAGIDDFFAILEFLHGGLMAQVQLDIASLERATGQVYADAIKQSIEAVQTKAYEWTFIASGLIHPNFLRTIHSVDINAYNQVLSLAERYSR